MSKQSKTLGIIPARKGSKRLPGKNTRSLAGKPLIQWSIEAAQASKAIDELLVTSDDREVLALAEQLGVEHVINRPQALASDTAATADAIVHALDALKSHTVAMPGDICLLQATSPLRSADDIDGAVQRYRQSGAPAVISVCELEHPLAWCAPLAAGDRMTHFVDQVKTVKRSQEAPACYRLNGAIFIISTAHFVEHRDFFDDNAIGYIMPMERSIDIDGPMDFKFAEFYLTHQ